MCGAVVWSLKHDTTSTDWIDTNTGKLALVCLDTEIFKEMSGQQVVFT